MLEVVADVATADAAIHLVESAFENFGKLDILRTSAGGPRGSFFEQLSDPDWFDGFELNVLSSVWMIRLALPHLRRSGRSRIINV